MIPFAGARLEQRFDLAGRRRPAALYWSDALMSGRVSRGEAWRFAVARARVADPRRVVARVPGAVSAGARRCRRPLDDDRPSLDRRRHELSGHRDRPSRGGDGGRGGSAATADRIDGGRSRRRRSRPGRASSRRGSWQPAAHPFPPRGRPITRCRWPRSLGRRAGSAASRMSALWSGENRGCLRFCFWPPRRRSRSRAWRASGASSSSRLRGRSAST